MNARAYHCPCCGGVVDAPTELDTIIRNMPPVRGALLRAIASRGGDFARTKDLVREVWRHCPDGGPIAPHTTVSIHVANIRADLAGTRWTVGTVHGRGYRLVAA